MSKELEKKYQVDILAQQAGGYFSTPNEQELAYTDLLFNICDQFGIHYYKATPKERYFVEEVARVTWAHQQQQITGIKTPIRPAFSA